MKKAAIFLLIAILGGASCVGVNRTDIPSDGYPLDSSTVSATVSTEPTKRIEPTATITPTETLLPTRSPTVMATPKPTLSIEGKEKRFLEIVVKSSNCRWPCIFGVEPGATSWEETIHSLGDFVKWEKPSDDSRMYWSFKISNEEGEYGGSIWQGKAGILTRIKVGTSIQTNILTVDKVLDLYGEPSEVYIVPYYPDPAYGHLDLILVYRERRTMLFYEWDEDTSGQSVLAYDPLSKYQALMRLVIIGDEDFSWSPQNVSNAVVPYNEKPQLYTLAEVTGMTNEQFTKKFAVSNRNNFIVIPMSFWDKKD